MFNPERSEKIVNNSKKNTKKYVPSVEQGLEEGQQPYSL